MFSINQQIEQFQSQIQAAQRDMAAILKSDVAAAHELQKEVVSSQSKAFQAALPKSKKDKDFVSTEWLDEMNAAATAVQAAALESATAYGNFAKSFVERRVEIVKAAQAEIQKKFSEFQKNGVDAMVSAVKGSTSKK
jgi:multidrug resistance efflux pump